MLRKSSLILLRIPFSLFLMPVYFFSLSQVPDIHFQDAVLVFVILHLFLYPASNGYNSYMDQDKGSIGLLKYPPKPHRELFYLTIALDGIAIALSLMVGKIFTACIIANIIASRAYSYRGIRLKKFPLTGFLTVIAFQGAVTYFIVFTGSSTGGEIQIPWQGMLISSLLFGSLYPLTQIYQHQQDLDDGVKTISYMLGYMGTFIFSGIMYLLAELLLFFYFHGRDQLHHFWLLQLFFLPVILYFFFWWHKVWTERSNASFYYAMLMNTVAALCTNAGFILLYFLNHGPRGV